jgi:hypothetical protein
MSSVVIDVVALQLVLGVLTGWLDRREREAIAYLVEENRLLRRQLGGRRLRFADEDRRRLRRERTELAGRPCARSPVMFHSSAEARGHAAHSSRPVDDRPARMDFSIARGRSRARGYITDGNFAPRGPSIQPWDRTRTTLITLGNAEAAERTALRALDRIQT